MVHVTVREREVEPEVVARLRAKLADGATGLPAKYRVLFSLRNIAGSEAHAAMMTGLDDCSALFRHEVAYCLGQRQDAAAIETLARILGDASEHPMVRHEAGEALGAIEADSCLEPLRAHQDDPVLEVAQTCQLALQRIKHLAARRGAAGSAAGRAAEEAQEGVPRFLSVDPTPPAPASTPLPELRARLLDEGAPIFERYRAMFALRNAGGPEAVEALAASFAGSRSALLKHEVAYVLGQMQDAHAVQVLRQVLEDPAENPMVRHEAAEALGSIAEPECIALLKKYARDPEPIVADSCVVALDMLEFEQSGAFQYADDGAADGTVAA